MVRVRFIVESGPHELMLLTSNHAANPSIHQNLHAREGASTKTEYEAKYYQNQNQKLDQHCSVGAKSVAEPFIEAKTSRIRAPERNSDLF